MHPQTDKKQYLIKYSQNFIKSKLLSERIIDITGVEKNDYVIEIGSGKGALTKHLSKCRKLIAIEKDRKLFLNLNEKFSSVPNIDTVCIDFLDFNLPIDFDYKVIGNIPFVLTTSIIKKLLEAENPPIECYIILQKEAAIRILGKESLKGSENLFSLKYKPFFAGEIIYFFNHVDFLPKPSVDVVMLAIRKREQFLISTEEKNNYYDFITYCFTAWKKNMEEILSIIFTPVQMSEIKNEYNELLNRKPSEVEYTYWMKLYKLFFKIASKENRLKVLGAFHRLEEQQKSIQKRTRTSLSFKSK